MAYCRKCGKEINDNAAFCRFCGEEVIRPNDVTEYGSAAEEREAVDSSAASFNKNTQKKRGRRAEKPRKPKKRRRLFPKLLLIILVSLLVFVGIKIYPLVKMYIEAQEMSQGLSALTSRELIKTDEVNVFYVTKKLKRIKGKSFLDNEPLKIRYRVSTVQDYEIASGEMEYTPQWIIESKGLALGPNYINVLYEYDNPDDNQEFNYLIYNLNDKNTDKLGMKTEDNDNDGLSDYYELTNSETDPYNADTDGNSIPDGEEDPDNDGLNNAEEQVIGSSAHAMDSDGDGLMDLIEKEYDTDLTNTDTDGDGFSDNTEIQIGSDPKNKRDPKKDTDVTFSKTADFNSGMKIDIDVETLPENASSFRVYEIPESYAVSKKNIDGMIGTGICLVMDGELTEAKIDIVLDCDDYVEGEDYYLYYFNEDTYECEYVEGQVQNGNMISATLSHFSKYCISSLLQRGKTRINYFKYGIDSLSSKEKSSALYDSYEAYLRDMYNYSDKAVVSINILTPDIDDFDAKRMDVKFGFNYFTPYFKPETKTGHSWLSYYYSGNDPDLKLNKLDEGVLDSVEFGTIGYGGWINNPGGIDRLKEAWDGTLKLQSGYRGLYSEARYYDKDGFTYKTFQSSTIPYISGGDIQPENMDMALISMPFVVDKDQFENICAYINEYHRKYDLNYNNCTTFARDVIDSAAIENTIEIDYTGKWNIEFANKYVGSAGSPGQAAFSIQKNYPDEHVYVLGDYEDDGTRKLWFTSKRAQSCALKREQEQENLIAEKQSKEGIFNSGDNDFPDFINSTENTGFIVYFSPIASIFGMPILFIQETERFVDLTQQDDIQKYLEDCAKKQGLNLKFTYIQVPEIIFKKIEKENIPDEYRFNSKQEYTTRINRISSAEDLVWDLLFHYCCMRLPANEFFDIWTHYSSQ